MGQWAEHLKELRRQDRLWKERRMVSGHGAQDGDARMDKDYRALIVFLGGPVAAWWDENWMSSEHLRYDAWRTSVEEALVGAGFLVYKPHTAFKGTWNPEAQAVNDAIISVSDAFIDMTPWGVKSEGTDNERELARKLGKHVSFAGPPANKRDDELVLERLVNNLMELAIIKNGAIHA